MLLLLQGQTREAWEPSTNLYFFRESEEYSTEEYFQCFMHNGGRM